MKLISYFLLLLLVTNCSIKDEKSTLSGSVKNNSDTKITINLPVDGKFFLGNNVEIVPNAEGVYNFTFPEKSEGIASVRNHFNVGFLIVEPNKQYSVSFDEENVVYDAESEKKSLLMEKIGLFDNARDFVDPQKNPDFESKNRFYSEMFANSVKILDESLKNKEISKETYQKIKNLLALKIADFKSTDYFFTFRMNYEATPEKHAEFAQIYLKAWQELYDEAFKNPDFSAYSGQTAFLLRYSMMQDIKRTGTLQFKRTETPYYITQIQFLKENLPPQLLEFAWANMMISGLSEEKYETEWIDNFEDFKKQFPESKLIETLNSYIEKVKAYHSGNKKPISFVEGYENINSLDELFSKLKGKVIYVDLWATWCVPCRKELQHSKENHETLETMEVTSVYLSLDNDQADETWKEMIQNLQLEGVHLRANATLKKEIDKFVRSIPHYIIVGKDGKIKVENAKRPSDKQELFDQLKAFL